MLNKFKYHWADFLFNTKIFPFITLIRYYVYSYILNREFVTVKLKKGNLREYEWTIRCRNRIDRNVIDYVFFKQYHQSSPANLNTTAPVIIDLGSNIGLTIADYKIRFPESKIYGYEMDSGNFRLAKKNCSKFNDVKLFNKAVWIRKGTISYENNHIPDAYAITNDPTSKGVQVDCVSIADILEENDLEHVDILKMDIEGAELEIFNEQDVSWLLNIKSFNIEFHNQTEDEISNHIRFFREHGFDAKKGLTHWNSVEGINNRLL